MAGIFSTLADLIAKALDPNANDRLPPAPQVLQNLGNWLDNLKDLSISVDGDLSKLQPLLDKFKLPDDAGDSILVRMLQYQYPRIAESLTLFGIIENEYNATGLFRHRIRWDRINQAMGSPQALLNQVLAGKLLTDDPDPTKGTVNTHLLTVHLAALLLAPRPLLLLEHDRIGIGALPATPDQPPENFQDNNPWKAMNDAPWLFTLEVPTPDALKELKPDAAGVQAFLNYLKSREFPAPPEPPLPHIDLPPLPEPDLASPPLVLPGFRRGSLRFGLAMRVNQPTQLYKPFDIPPDWQVVVQGPVGTPDRPPGFDLTYDSTKWSLEIDPSDLPPEIITAVLRRTNSEPVSFVKTDLLLIEAAQISAFARLNKPGGGAPLFSLGFSISGLRARLKSQYLPGMNAPLQIVLDVDTAYDQGRGLRVQGASDGRPALGIDFVQPINQSFGADGASLTLQQARFRLESELVSNGLALRANIRLSVTAALGPVNATVDNFGAWVGLSGNRKFRALGPSGVGISIDSGIVQGGGFLSESPPDSGRFEGLLVLKILALGVGAFGIYEQTLEHSTSFVAVIGARFPGIQLGFGFMLTGIGGLVGVNRRADVDQLSARLLSGSAGNVLFCEDPVRNAPALFNDLAAFFPSADGVHILGPTLQLSWVYIVRFDIGVLIELPGPSKIIIVGSARAVIPGLGSAVPLVNLRVDIIGGVDFSSSLVFFDASLVDSTVLGVYTLAGDSSFRFSYGASAYVLLSIGGFHPSFNPEPVKIRKLARASSGFSINAGIKIWMRQEFYFAFTPNTLQLGGRVEAGLEIGPVSAHGYFAFDALVQFKPFYFTFNISAGFDIEFDGHSLASVRLNGTVSGPGPLVVSASISFKILFVRFSFDKTFTLGSGNGDIQRVDVDVLKAMLEEVPRVENIHAEDAEHAVILKKANAPGIALVAASSKITWTQRLAPLGARLERIGGTPLSRPYQVSLTQDMAAADANDLFGLGSYANVNDSEALNTNTFHSLKAGITLSSGVVTQGNVPASPTVQVFHIPSFRALFPHLNISAWHVASALQDALGSPGGPAKVAASAPIVGVHEEAWAAHGSDGAVLAQNVSQFQAFQAARQPGGFAVPVEEEPLNLAGV